MSSITWQKELPTSLMNFKHLYDSSNLKEPSGVSLRFTNANNWVRLQPSRETLRNKKHKSLLSKNINLLTERGMDKFVSLSPNISNKSAFVYVQCADKNQNYGLYANNISNITFFSSLYRILSLSKEESPEYPNEIFAPSNGKWYIFPTFNWIDIVFFNSADKKVFLEKIENQEKYKEIHYNYNTSPLRNNNPIHGGNLVVY